MRQSAFAEVAGAGAGAEQLAGLAMLGAEATDRTDPGDRLDPLARSDLEQELAETLEARGVRTPTRSPPRSRRPASAANGPTASARCWATRASRPACASSPQAPARVLLAELEEATTRIADLVAAVRSYSYLDQAPRQAVDIHEGLETTLVLVGHKLREKGIEIVRDLDPELPAVEASGSELNQVWTNLIDNAADAVDLGGRITLRTGRQGGRVLVEVGDDGPGVPPELRARVFDAFFTTKPVGRGRASGSTSPSASSSATTASSVSSPSPATPASRCSCRSAERALDTGPPTGHPGEE